VVVNGKTTGVWKRTTTKDKVFIEIDYFTKPGPALQRLIETASVGYGKFLEKKVELH
jgi:hypothetical protein